MSWIHPAIIIYSILLSSYVVTTLAYVGHVNYFYETSDLLTNISWAFTIPIVVPLLWKNRKNIKSKQRIKLLFVLFVMTSVLAAFFRLGPIGNLAVIYHMIFSKQVTLITEVTPKSDDYFISKRCKGELNAFKNSRLSNNTLCGISYQDWKSIKTPTLILLTGNESYLGMHFERYAILPSNVPIPTLKQSIHSAGFVYVATSFEHLAPKTKELNLDIAKQSLNSD